MRGTATQRRRSNEKIKPRTRRQSSRAAARGEGRTTAAPEPREKEAPHISSPTAVAAEALRTGVSPRHLPQRKEQIPREDAKMRVGDPDDDGLQNEYSGEDTPGGSTPTPDQNVVDDIGRAYGLQEEDAGTLRSGAEVLGKRDKRRSELRAPRRPQP
jgi:hypothetical protein